MEEAAETSIVSECYHCRTPLPEGADICPNCGHKQYRICYCGAQIPVTASTCPNCGVDWSRSYRVQRKSRRHPDWKRMLKFALVGSVTALVVAAVFNAVITGLAQRGLSGSQELPASLVQKFYLAMKTIGTALLALIHQLADKAGGLGTFAVVLVAGAATGAIIYLARAGFLRIRRSRVSRRRRTSSKSDTPS